MCIMRADSILTVLKILFAFKIETHWANAIIMFLHFILLLAAFCFILLFMCKKNTDKIVFILHIDQTKYVHIYTGWY